MSTININSCRIKVSLNLTNVSQPLCNSNPFLVYSCQCPLPAIVHPSERFCLVAVVAQMRCSLYYTYYHRMPGQVKSHSRFYLPSFISQFLSSFTLPVACGL